MNANAKPQAPIKGDFSPSVSTDKLVILVNFIQSSFSREKLDNIKNFTLTWTNNKETSLPNLNIDFGDEQDILVDRPGTAIINGITHELEMNVITGAQVAKLAFPGTYDDAKVYDVQYSSSMGNGELRSNATIGDLRKHTIFFTVTELNKD